MQAIHSHRSDLERLANSLRTPAILEAFDRWDHECWCVSVAGDALVRLRQLTEQNFMIKVGDSVLATVGPMGIVAVARYTFELDVWMRLFAKDRRYGLVYYDELLKTQHRFYQDTLSQYEREVEWLKSFEEKERAEQREVLRDIKFGEDGAGAVLDALSVRAAIIDAEAARRFSLYAEEARINGYGYQAHLVETQAIPQIEETWRNVKGLRVEFDD